MNPEVIVGCEESGKVRDVLLNMGIYAVSVDIEPSRSHRGEHWQMDIVEAIENINGKTKAIFLFPDCTKMAVSGNRWYGKGTAGHDQRLKAIDWTLKLWDLACEKADYVVLENPVSAIFPELKERKTCDFVQYIQPHQFGHGETKKTGLAVKGFPKLEPTNEVDGREQRIWKMPPSATRKRDRSETFDGIADAFGSQWGIYL